MMDFDFILRIILMNFDFILQTILKKVPKLTEASLSILDEAKNIQQGHE